MRAVIGGRIEGDGGAIGAELQEALRTAIDQHMPKRGGG